MTTYNILTIGTSLESKLAGKFNVADTENFLDRLEETLYILFELEPKSREWKREFLKHLSVEFTYHFCEDSRVEKQGNNIIVYEENEGWKSPYFFSNFFQKTLDIYCPKWYYNIRKGKENPEHQKG